VTDDRALVVPPGVWTGTALVAAAAMLFALGDRPYSYYQALRWVVLFASAFGLVASFKTDRPGWGILFLPMAFVFGPAEFVSFRRETWFWLDLAGALVMVAAAFMLRWDLRDGRLSRSAEFVDWLAGMAFGLALAWMWAAAGLGLAVSVLTYVPGFDSLMDALRGSGLGGGPTFLVASLLLALGWLYREWMKAKR